ncbi:MAG: HEAT repeat domain-containing protein [Caldilineaceae bacterium]
MPQKTLNRHQKAAFRPGEHRVRGDEIDRLIALAASDDPADRLEAAENLCPCHLRRRIEDAWQALYRMMEDPDVRVRRAAWHTLEDGGCPTDLALEPIFDRAVENENDGQVRRFVEMFAVPNQQERARREMLRAAHSPYQQRGKCDFCAGGNVPVRVDYQTELAGRFALICKGCDQQAV